MRKLTALVITAAIFLTGCSVISSGTITDKKHSDAYYYPVTYCAIYGKNGICMMYSTRQDYMPASWSFDLAKEDKTGYVRVSESTWNSYDIGDYYGEK